MSEFPRVKKAISESPGVENCLVRIPRYSSTPDQIDVTVNPLKPGAQSKALCGAVCTLLLLVFWFYFYFILFNGVLCILILQSALFWFSLLQCWLLQLQLYTTLLYIYSLFSCLLETNIWESVHSWKDAACCMIGDILAQTSHTTKPNAPAKLVVCCFSSIRTSYHCFD